MYEQLARLMADKFQVPENEIMKKSTLKDLGLDSLDTVELAMAIEQEWGARVTDDELNEAQQLDAIIELVTSRAAKI